MKCAIYARFSTDNQNDESIDSQVACCADYIKSEGWQLLPEHIYTDYAVSGATDQRRGFQGCIDNARRKQFDAVVVFSTSRFAREQYDELHYRRILDECGVRLISASERFHNLEGVARIASEGSVRLANEIIRHQIKDHAARGIRHITEKGFIATKPCYGYRKKYVPDPEGAIDKRTKKLRQRLTFEVVEEEANVIRRIFGLYLAGNGAKRIAQNLNEERIPGPQGETWTFTAIRDMLRRETYLGWIVRNKRSKIKAVNGRIRFTRNLEKDWQIKERAFPPIVDEETFRRVAERIRDQAGKWDASALRARENHSRYLLTGLIKCAQCGKNFICRKTRTKKGDKIYHHYVCSGRNSRGPAGCPNATAIVRDDLDRYLLEICGRRRYDPEVVKQFLELADRVRESALREYEVNHEKLEKEISRLTKKRTALVEDYERFDEASRNVIRDRIQELSGQIARISEKLAMPQELDKVLTVSAGKVQVLIPTQGLSPEERMELLRGKAEEFAREARAGNVFSAREAIRRVVQGVQVSADGTILILGNDKKVLAERNLLDLKKFTSEIDKMLTSEARPFSDPKRIEPMWRISKKLYEALAKHPETKEWVAQLVELVRLELVDEETPPKPGWGFFMLDATPSDFFTEDMLQDGDLPEYEDILDDEDRLEYGVPKGAPHSPPVLPSG